MDAETITTMKGLLPALIMGLTFSLLGIAALLGSLFSWRRRDFSLLFFGMFSGLYGFRILVRTLPIDVVFGWDWPWLGYLENGLRYASLPLLVLFLEQILGRGWKDSIRWLWRAGLAFAVVAIGLELITRRPGVAWEASLVMLVLGLILVLAHGAAPAYRATREQKGVLLAYLVGTLVSVNAFLVARSLVPWQFKTEYPGLLVALIMIGYLLINRMTDNRAHMLALREELDLARRIQQSILPARLPRAAGISLAVRFQPMTAVAGDYYDFHQLDESRLGILVADVSGHGIPAALIASMAKVAFAAKRDCLPDPAALLEGLNDSFEGTMEGQYLTATCLVVDREALRVSFAGAAHPPVMHWRAQQQDVQHLKSTGLMVGLFPAVNAKSAAVPVAPGDRLIAYSDGVTEAADSRDEMFEEERLEQFLATHHDLDAEAFADRLMRTVADWRGADRIEDAFDDDLTLVVLDITADGEDQM